MEKWLEYLKTAEKKTQTIDHMIYITFPLIKEKRLLLKILSEMNLIAVNIINSVLQYEYIYKRIELTKDAKTNLNIFFQKCAPRYEINEIEIKTIKELLDIYEKHQKSPFEFVKNDNVIILSDNLIPEVVTIDKTKNFLTSIKIILKKVQKVVNKL